MLRLILSIAVAATTWIVPAEPAMAGETDDDRAKAAFQEGVAHFKAQRFEDANAAFRRANELKPSWKLLYNIGQCEASMKHYDLALTVFETYLAEGGDEIPSDRQEELLAEVERLRRMVGFLEVSGRDGDVVVVDGTERGALPEAAKLRVSMGSVSVRVLRDGVSVLDRQVEIFGGGAVALQVGDEEAVAERKEPETGETAPDTETAANREPGPEEGGGSRKRVWTWVAFAVGGAAGIGAGVTGGLAVSKRSDIDSQCADGWCPPELKDDNDQVYNLALTTDILIGTAALGVAAGVLLYFLEGRETKSVAAAVVPALGEESAGLLLRGRF